MIKVAVIGVGNMGKHHARVYSEIPNVNLVAVSDLNQLAGQEIANRYSCRYYTNYQQMIAKESLDLVSICVPTNLHFQVASFCLDQRLHLLLEKPISDNLNNARKLLKLAKENNLKLLVGHIERHNPALKKVKELIEDKKIGRIISIIARRVGGLPQQVTNTNVLVDLAIHDIDISNYLLNDLPSKIMVNKQSSYLTNQEDSVELFLKYQTASSYIQANWISPVKIRRLDITGTNGYLELDYISQTITFYQGNYEKFKKAAKSFSQFISEFSEPDTVKIEVDKKEPLKEEILYFIKAIEDNLQIDSTFAVEALEIALQN